MCTHLQVVVLYKLVEWFPFSRLPSHIYSAIVGYNIWNVSWKICFQVRNEICSLQGVVFHASSHEVWNPKLPMPDDMWTILPTYSHSKIGVKKGHVYKGIVKMVYWILGWFRVESLCNYCLCCVLKPLLSDVMVDFIIWWFQLQVAAYASNQMCSKGMGDKFVSYIKYLLFPCQLVCGWCILWCYRVTQADLGHPRKWRKSPGDIPRGNESPLQGISSNVAHV